MRKSAERETAGKRSTKTAPQKTFDADALLNTMGGMDFVASPDYRIEYMNEAARRKIGRDMTGKPCFKVFHGFEDRCPWCMGELVLQGQTIRQEIQGSWTSAGTPTSSRPCIGKTALCPSRPSFSTSRTRNSPRRRSCRAKPS